MFGNEIDREPFMRVRLTFCKSSAIINLINNIRFQGDNYHYGLTVKGSDKTAIKEVLEVYSF